MKHMKRLMIIVVLVMVSLQLAACGSKAAEPAAEEGPAQVEHLQGANPTRITLTEDAAKRLDIQTVAVTDGQSGTIIPYAAVLYDIEGHTWTYTNPEPLVFVRTPITVDHVENGQAFLSAGPSSGSVVTVGAEELYGSETEFEEE